MEKKKKSFVLYHDTLDVLDMLSDEQAGKLFKAIKDYQTGTEPELDALLSIVFLPFKKQFIRDGIKYENTVERNKENGKKGGRPKKTQDNQENPVGYLETQGKPNEPRKADSDSDSDSDSVNDNDSVIIPKERKFKFCNWREVDEYIITNKLIFTNHPHAKSFFDNLNFQRADLDKQLKMIKDNTQKYN